MRYTRNRRRKLAARLYFDCLQAKIQKNSKKFAEQTDRWSRRLPQFFAEVRKNDSNKEVTGYESI